MADFVHLHVHSQYSLLDGLSKFPDLVAKAKKDKMAALALTDHGVMYGTIPFYLECKNQGIKPIIGCEIYIARKSRFDKKPGEDSGYNHLILLAKNELGYKNLMKIVTLAHLEGFYYKPRADWEILQKYHQGLIALTACIEGEVPSLLIKGQDEKAQNAAKKYLELFGDDFYLEIQSHLGVENQNLANKKIIALSRKLGIPLVATNDVHYVHEDDAQAQDALLAVQTKKMINDKNRLTMLDSPDFYLKSPLQMQKLFPDYPDALENTCQIARKCDLEIQIGKWILPDYPLPKAKTAEQELKEMARERMAKRFPGSLPEIKKRLDYELEIICNKGFATYFLVVQDFVNWAKAQNIRVGPGRGSAAGSLVSFVLRITSINPLEHNLPFERFMNPERPTPPDIDLDFAEDRRDEVIAYVTEKYGKDKVAQIITFGRMEARGSIRDIGRVLGMPYSDPDKIAKLIPVGFSIDQALSSVGEIQQYYNQPEFKKLLDLARRVEGSTRHASTHAAGVVIADKDLTEYTPLARESKGERIITQYDMYALDLNVSDQAIGLLKMDFLGLRNLTILQKSIDFVKQETGETIDVSGIPLDDQKVYKLLSRGETAGVFQLESSGMRRLAKNLQPSRFSDISAMVALYRPGPMELISEFIQGKQDAEKVNYVHPDLKPILQETYGIAVYQEQCLQIAHDMAGYSMAEADILRRAIGKKKRSIMDKEHKKFMLGAQKKGYSNKTAEKVWHYIEKFAGYGFNKAHSASYAMIAYQTAYMKANFPVEFMAALLTAESDNPDKIAVEIEECRRMGIVVAPPDINQSVVGFIIEKMKQSLQAKAIRFGLSAIKNVGEAAISEILAARKTGRFQSLTDFCQRVDTQKVNKKVLESLIQVGALDAFGKRSAMLSGLEAIRSRVEEEIKIKANGQTSFFDQLASKKETTKTTDKLPDIEELSTPELLSLEKALLGFYLSERPTSKLILKLNDLVSHDLSEITLQENSQRATIGGVVAKVKKIFTKSGNKEMAFVTLENSGERIDMVVFPNIYSQYQELLLPDNVLLVEGTIDAREDRLSFLADKIKKFDENTIPAASYTIKIPGNTSREKLTQIQEVLRQNSGQDELLIALTSGFEIVKKIKLPFKVKYSNSLISQIDNILTA